MKATLLLVDDNPTNLAALFDHLRAAKYQVLVTDNGIEAVEQTVRAKPELILLDVRMPGMDGYETCRAIKTNPDVAHIPIIFLSALADTDDRLKGFEAGGVDYISKPVDVLEVEARIQTHLTLARLQRQLTTTNEELEEIVGARTQELQNANSRLQSEIERRQQEESEKKQLLSLVRGQNQQLHDFTSWLLQSRPVARLELTQLISRQLLNNLAAVAADLQTVLAEPPSENGGGYGENGRLQDAHQRLEQLIHYLQEMTLAKKTAELNLPNAHPTSVTKLTHRERQVLRLLCDGLSPNEIGSQLKITDVTVRAFRMRIMRKLNITHMPGLVKFALRNNLTELD